MVNKNKQKRGVASFLVPPAILLATGAGIWALINATQPQKELKSYKDYKKASLTEAVEEQNKPKEPTAASPEKKDSSPDKKSKKVEKSAGPEDKPAVKPEPVQVAEATAPASPQPASPQPASPQPASPQPAAPRKDSPAPATAPPPLPRETLIHISKGMELVDRGKFELAEVEFEEASKTSPDSPEVYSIWGAALRMQKKYKGANRRFARAVELAPNDSEITFNWGLSRLYEKKPDEAIQLFEKTVKLDPEHYLAHNYLGKSYGQKQQFKKEEAAYLRVLEIKEDFAQAHFNLGIVLSLQKKFEDAAPHFQRAIKLDKQFEKPFVVQFLTAMGLKNPMKKANLKPSKSNKKKKDGEQVAKLDTNTPTKDTEAKKSEGSDHSMEGSSAKVVKEVTNVKGHVSINGQAVDSRGVVYLETKNKLKVPDQTTQTIKIYQKGMQFVPGNSVVMVGSTLKFVNDDVEVHNIFSRSLNNQFNLGAMSAGTGKEIKVTQPGPIILRCNIHKDMLGTVFVVPNGYFAQTDDHGAYEFKNVKSQEYIMEFWHPQLYPEEVQAHARNAILTGVDQTLDFKIKSSSEIGEIHDLIDETDYNKVVDMIESEVQGAINAWKNGKKYLSRKRMLIAITKYYDGAGLKGAISKSFSENRSEKLEGELDVIRKHISGMSGGEKVTEDSLKFKAERVVAQLRNNVQELEHRLKPAP